MGCSPIFNLASTAQKQIMSQMGTLQNLGTKDWKDRRIMRKTGSSWVFPMLYVGRYTKLGR